MSTMIPGIPPDGGGPPDLPSAGDGLPSITSEEGGGPLDQIRLAIMSLQHFAEQSHDDQELHDVHKCITALQKILAGCPHRRLEPRCAPTPGRPGPILRVCGW